MTKQTDVRAPVCSELHHQIKVTCAVNSIETASAIRAFFHALIAEDEHALVIIRKYSGENRPYLLGLPKINIKRAITNDNIDLSLLVNTTESGSIANDTKPDGVEDFVGQNPDEPSADVPE